MPGARDGQAVHRPPHAAGGGGGQAGGAGGAAATAASTQTRTRGGGCLRPERRGAGASAHRPVRRCAADPPSPVTLWPPSAAAPRPAVARTGTPETDGGCRRRRPPSAASATPPAGAVFPPARPQVRKTNNTPRPRPRRGRAAAVRPPRSGRGAPSSPPRRRGGVATHALQRRRPPPRPRGAPTRGGAAGDAGDGRRPPHRRARAASGKRRPAPRRRSVHKALRDTRDHRFQSTTTRLGAKSLTEVPLDRAPRLTTLSNVLLADTRGRKPVAPARRPHPVPLGKRHPTTPTSAPSIRINGCDTFRGCRRR